MRSIPNSGFYKKSLPSGSIKMWAWFHYKSLGNEKYLIRNSSNGNPAKPNPFDKGSIVNVDEMYKILVEAGALK